MKMTRTTAYSVVVILLLLLGPADAWSNVAYLSSWQCSRTTSLDMVATRKQQRFWNRNTNTLVRTPVLSQPRPTVSYDPKTGTVKDKESGRSGGKWKSFKSGIYSSFDAVGSLANKLRPTRTNNPPREGYKEVIEQRIFQDTTTTLSPGERLMKEYQQRSPPIEVTQPDDSAFDSFKETIYSFSEGIFREPKIQVQPPIVTTFKASIQPNLATSTQVREALPQLNSRNPVQRWWAERKIRQWEKEQRRREDALERERQMENFKETIYNVVDTVQTGMSIVVETPNTIVKAATTTQRAALSLVEWAASIPSTIQSTAETVVAIPRAVSQAVTEIQEQVETSVKSTQQFVADVAAIPQKVVDTVENTQRTVENTVKSVDEAVTTVKIWTGLEKPKPPPPKEITASSIAWGIAGAVAKGSAQVAWFVGKTTVQLGWKVTQVAFATATSQPEVKTKAVLLTTAAEIPPAPPELPPPPQIWVTDQTTGSYDPEVVEALALAQRALTKNELESTGINELERAVERAKQAAIAATQDMIEVENIMKQNGADDL